MMSQFEETMDSGAMELDADRIMRANNSFGIEKKTKDLGAKSFTMPLKQMNCGCSICGKTSQNGVGGICKGCWNQFQEKGVRIGNITEFEQFTEAVKNQVARISIFPDNTNTTVDGQEKLMENIKQIVPAIFSKSDADPVSKRSLHIEKKPPGKDPSPKPPGITRSRTFTNFKQEDNTQKVHVKSTVSPTRIKRATTGISMDKPAASNNGLGSRKSTTAVPDKRIPRRDVPPSTSSSTASHKEVYTPVTVAKSKYLAISLEQIEQRNRRMQSAANKSRTSKMRNNRATPKKKGYKNDPLSMMNGGKNALKRMACDTKKHNSGSEDDDEDDYLDNVPSLSTQDKLIKRPSSSPRVRTEYTPRTFDFEYGNQQQEEKTSQPKPRGSVETYGLYTADGDREREKPPSADVNSCPAVTFDSAADGSGSLYYQPPSTARPMRGLISKSDYFMPVIPETTQEEDVYFDQATVRATKSMPISKYILENNENKGVELQRDPSDYMAYKQGFTTNALNEAGELTKKIENAFGTSIDSTGPLNHKEGMGDQSSNLYTVAANDKNGDQENNLYTIAKQFPVAAPIAQDNTYFEPFNGRNTPSTAMPFRVSGSVNLMITDGKVDNKPEDCYTGGIGPKNATATVAVKDNYRSGDPPTNNDYFAPKSKSDSIYAADGNFFKNQVSNTSYTTKDSQYFGSESSVLSRPPSIAPSEAASGHSDSDCYTGALYKAPQFGSNYSKKDTNLSIENRPRSRLDFPKASSDTILQPTFPSEHSGVVASPDSQGPSRMFRKQRLTVDTILDNSVSSAGEFFSKAIISFGNHNGNSNQSSGGDNQAICSSCPGASFNEDQMDFGDITKKNSQEYIDWPEGLKPNYGCRKEQGNTSREPQPFDVDYKKYDALDFEQENQRQQNIPMFDNAQDLRTYGKQNKITWDGRPWEEVAWERDMPPPRRGSRGRNIYTDLENCRICPGRPNSNNSWSMTSAPCLGSDVNNNYPNYEMYDNPPPPPQPQRLSQAAPQMRHNSDDDYAPCIYAPPAAQEHLLARPRQAEWQTQPQPVQQQSYSQPRSYMTDSPYFGACSGSPYGYTGYDEPPPPEIPQPREPSPPPVPKIYKVGEIRVRNNVENNDDYAENINRDLGHDDSSFGGSMAFNDLSAYGRAFAFPTAHVPASEPARSVQDVQKALERERSVVKPQGREKSFTPRAEYKDTRKSSSYSHKTYDDTDDQKRSWAAERKSLTDMRQKSEDTRRSQKPGNPKKPKRSASQSREASYVNRPSAAGGDHMRSAKPQSREERSFKPSGKYRKEEKKKEEETANKPGFLRKIGRAIRLVN